MIEIAVGIGVFYVAALGAAKVASLNIDIMNVKAQRARAWTSVSELRAKLDKAELYISRLEGVTDE